MSSASRPGNSAKHPARLMPARALPAYSYVSGKFPHPLRDPAGHSYGAEAPPSAIGRERDWRRCEAYVWGIDLFNCGYYWEAHETWEAVWHAAGRRGRIADFCKALIKLAAAGVKAREGRADGVRRHALRAQQLLAGVAGGIAGRDQRFMGMPLATLIECASALGADPEAIVDTSDERVVVVMPFRLPVEGG